MHLECCKNYRKSIQKCNNFVSVKSNGAISIEQTIEKLQLKYNCTTWQLIKDMSQKIKEVPPPPF